MGKDERSEAVSLPCILNISYKLIIRVALLTCILVFKGFLEAGFKTIVSD